MSESKHAPQQEREMDDRLFRVTTEELKSGVVVRAETVSAYKKTLAILEAIPEHLTGGMLVLLLVRGITELIENADCVEDMQKSLEWRALAWKMIDACSYRQVFCSDGEYEQLKDNERHHESGEAFADEEGGEDENEQKLAD